MLALVNEPCSLVTHFFFPVFSSTQFKLLNTFLVGILEILWMKEMENLIS